MATLGTITVGILPYMLPLFVELRAGTFVNLQFVRMVEWQYMGVTMPQICGAKVWYEEKSHPIEVSEPYFTPFRQLIEKFHKEIMKELG